MWQSIGWKSADVRTLESASMFAGLTSTMLKQHLHGSCTVAAGVTGWSDARIGPRGGERRGEEEWAERHFASRKFHRLSLEAEA